ncbi:unnamed protein product [Ascophyllum nodosum]
MCVRACVRSAFLALFFSCLHSLGRASSTFHIDLGVLPLERGLRNRKRAKCACNPSKASDLFLFSTSGAEAPSTPFQATPSPTCHAWPYTVTAGTLCHRVFLETLEPYVLTGRLKTLSPEVLKAFVDRCQSVGDMLTAERLLLRLEPRSFDLSTLLPLLRRYRLHSALLAVRAARGDYVISVEEILREVMSVADREHGTVPLSGSLEASPGEGKGAEPAATAAAAQEPLRPYPADPTFDELGYKVLLYLTRCFQGRVLGGVESMSAGQTIVARSSLLHLLVRPTLSPSGATPRSDDLAPVLDKSSSHPSRPQQHQRRWRWRGALFPYLAILLYLDAAATIEVLSVAMDSPEAVFRESADEAAAGLINPGASSPPVPGGASSATLTAYSREASSSSSVLEASKARSAGGGERKPAAGRGGGSITYVDVMVHERRRDSVVAARVK